MPKSALGQLLRKRVIIRANGLTYEGVLIEIGPTEVILRRKNGFASIGMDRITSIRGADEPAKKDVPRFIDPSFYTAD